VHRLQEVREQGPDGAFLDGCPWDAIEMVPIEEVEAAIGFKMAV